MAKIQVISGGQTGVDQAALRAAKQLGVKTGGYMPKGWLTEDGPRPDFAELYGMTECVKPGYPARTLWNVRESSITLWYGPTGSRGCKCTSDACLRAGRRMTFPLLNNADADAHHFEAYAPRNRRGEIVLNCAGNRESGNPGIGEKAETYFVELFTALLAAG